MLSQEQDILEGVNPRQAEAIRLLDGPLLIAAGAGTGKTRVITRRIANLIAHGVEPWRILGITFTNKAAQEMVRRVRDLTGVDRVFLSTFHSFCAHLLRREAEHLGISRSFTIYDADDQTAAVAAAMKSLGHKGSRGEARDIARQISDAKNHLIGPEEFATAALTSWSQVAAQVYVAYEAYKTANNALDFDDLLSKAVEVLSGHPEVLARWQDRFRYVLVDEFQDTNACQYELVRLLGEKHRNLCVTGDPDQSIYAWRGASPENLFTFEKDFPEARCVRLEQNYRSTARILAAAGGLVRNNRLRKDVTLWTEGPVGDPVRLHVWPDERAEAGGIVRTIARRVDAGADPSDFAIFYRVNALSRTFEEALLLAGIPYVLVGALEFYGRREVKDLLAYLRVVANPADDLSLARILNVPRRGIGDKAAETLARRAAAGGRGLLAAMRDLPPGTLAGKASQGVADLLAALDGATGLAATSVAEALAYVVERTDYLASLGPLTDVETIDRRENVEELLRAALEFQTTSPDPSVAAFLERIALLNDAEAKEAAPGGSISLMSLHAAKGLEFPVVWIAGLEEGLLPHFGRLDDPSDLEEERRLLYVGMTRARRELHLSRVEWRTLHGRMEPTRRSRFLAEIPFDDADPFPEPAPVAPASAPRGRAVRSEVPERGDRVRHPVHGEGEVLDVLGWGQRTRVKVRFDREGIKDLIHEHAQLTRI